MGRKFNADLDGELLSAYLDNALSPKQKKEMDMLLAESAEARTYLQGLKCVQKAFQNWSPAEPDAFFLRRIEARIAADGLTHDIKESWSMRLQKCAVAALILLSVGGMFWVSHLRQNHTVQADLETFLSGSLDQDVKQVVAVKESDVSKEMIWDLILTDNVR